MQPVVSRHACVEMGGRQWKVEEASSSKLVLSRVRLEDEDVNFSAAKVAVREEIRQRLQDIRHFEGEHKVLFERMQDEAEDADQLAVELGNCARMMEFSMHGFHTCSQTHKCMTFGLNCFVSFVSQVSQPTPHDYYHVPSLLRSASTRKRSKGWKVSNT